jgi:hypothetical protein
VDIREIVPIYYFYPVKVMFAPADLGHSSRLAAPQEE